MWILYKLGLRVLRKTRIMVQMEETGLEMKARREKEKEKQEKEW